MAGLDWLLGDAVDSLARAAQPTKRRACARTEAPRARNACPERCRRACPEALLSLSKGAAEGPVLSEPRGESKGPSTGLPSASSPEASGRTPPLHRPAMERGPGGEVLSPAHPEPVEGERPGGIANGCVEGLVLSAAEGQALYGNARPQKIAARRPSAPRTARRARVAPAGGTGRSAAAPRSGPRSMMSTPTRDAATRITTIATTASSVGDRRNQMRVSSADRPAAVSCDIGPALTPA